MKQKNPTLIERFEQTVNVLSSHISSEWEMALKFRMFLELTTEHLCHDVRTLASFDPAVRWSEYVLHPKEECPNSVFKRIVTNYNAFSTFVRTIIQKVESDLIKAGMRRDLIGIQDMLLALAFVYDCSTTGMELVEDTTIQGGKKGEKK